MENEPKKTEKKIYKYTYDSEYEELIRKQKLLTVMEKLFTELSTSYEQDMNRLKDRYKENYDENIELLTEHIHNTKNTH